MRRAGRRIGARSGPTSANGRSATGTKTDRRGAEDRAEVEATAGIDWPRPEGEGPPSRGRPYGLAVPGPGWCLSLRADTLPGVELSRIPGPEWCRRILPTAVVLGRYCALEQILDDQHRHRCRLNEAHDGPHTCWCNRS